MKIPEGMDSKEFSSYNQSPVMQFVVQALADDFENVENLVNYHVAPAQPMFTQVEIMSTLVALIAGGHVQPYLYSEVAHKYVASEFVLMSSEKFWFGLTSKGKELLG